MKVELPCEIVQDLLPNYIDGLTSPCSTESVEEHLQKCDNCQNIYSDMKKEEQEKVLLAEAESNVNSEKVLFKRINKRLHKKVKRAVMAGLVAAVLVFAGTWFLFNAPVNVLPMEAVTVSAAVYRMDELLVVKEGKTEGAVNISASEEEEEVTTFQIPGSPLTEIGLTESVLEKYEYISVISWKSPYHLYAIDWAYEESEREEDTIYVKSYRTSFWGNEAFSPDQTMSGVEFRKINKIVYVHSDGTETVLWENVEE